MDRFEVGMSYGVLHGDEREETVTIAARDARSVTLSDGRRVRILVGEAPDGGDEEVLRIDDERGAVATGGVVRVCHLRPNGQGNGPRVELFARRKRAGWDAWGNEV